MIELSVSVEGMFGLTWPTWKRLVRSVEDLGFAGLYLSDHFLLNDPPDCPALEPIVALTYLADQTERVRFGPMVAPLSVRDPVMLARQAAALDDLSGGRMVLGLGTGWEETEHRNFGYDLGDIPTRFARLEEGLEVIGGLLRTERPVTYAGRFFRLQNAILAGPGRQGGPPLMIGGSGPRRTLPLVARYADVWNAQELTPEQVRERSAALDGLLRAAGRHPGAVRRTMNAWVICGRMPAEFEARVRGFRRFAPLHDVPLDHLLEQLRTDWHAIVGTPEEVVTRLRAYEAAGIAELSVQWPGVDDVEGLEVLAAEVMPRLSPECRVPSAECRDDRRAGSARRSC
jgi:alkanesulfonate monooxygenase SsuD/methylene tetrahydromethanopterin reductase-like flavin-dependent oxidoreductase (luciferase family)